MVPDELRSEGNYRRPTTGPTANDLADAQRWDTLVENSLPSVQAAAEKWRVGLAAFVTIVTGGLLVKGPDVVNDLSTGWRVVITVLTALGLLLTLAGLWFALRAAAGSPAPLNYPAIVAQYGGVRQFHVACARRAADELRWARILVAMALVMIVAGLITWWWAPTAEKNPPAFTKIDYAGTRACGELASADSQLFRLKIKGESATLVIPYRSATNVRVVASC